MAKMAIITPCSRPENLERILLAIQQNVAPYFDVDWRIIFDAEELAEPMRKVGGTLAEYIEAGAKFSMCTGIGVSGNQQRNKALDDLKDDRADMVYFLDDDTIPFGPMFKLASGYDTISNAFVFAQRFPNGSGRLLASPLRMVPMHIDTAQFILPHSFIGDARWDVHDYCADGHFFTGIYEQHKDRFIFINQVWCWYNYLR